MPEYCTMDPSRLILNRIFPVIIAFFFTGCATTYLDGPQLGTVYGKLAALGTREVVVGVDIPAEERTLGHQWVFLMAPVGSIRVHDLRQLASVAIFRKLAERGYRPAIQPEESILEPEITIDEFDVSCSVPDLFFVRKVNCSAMIAGHSRKAPGVKVTGRGGSSEFRTVGFKPQLEPVLDQALSDALDAFLNGVHL